MSAGRAAGDSGYREGVQLQIERLLRGTPYHSLRLPDGSVIPGLIPIDVLEQRIAAFPIPRDLRGCTVLDIGAASGWNSFEMLRRGAAVTAVDCVEFEEFAAVRDYFSPRVEYLLRDMDELTPVSVGAFDYVLFFGVLYHLRHPLLALEKVCALTKEAAFVESFVSDPVGGLSESCSLEFYENDELGGQIDNWFGPTVKCLMALCRSAGFVRVSLDYRWDRRAGLTCYRRWEPEPESAEIPPAWLYSAVNNRTNDIYFHTNKDEYLCIYFRTPETGLARDVLRIEVDGYGVNALAVAGRGGKEWQVNSRLPPGLAPGEHSVRLRTAATRFDEQRTIVVLDSSGPAVPVPPLPDMRSAPTEPPPEPIAIENNLDRSTVFRGHRAERLCCRFRSSEPNLSRETVLACIDREEDVAPVAFLTDFSQGEWQANLTLPADLAAGAHALRLRTLRSDWSEAAGFTVERSSPQRSG